ncbi:isoleucine--tRNA ligase [Candidatus Riflebacteria bacterium]
MFEQVNSSIDFPENEEKILDFWKKKKIFQKSVDQRKDCPPFVFFEGPPTANGIPHPGHVLTRVIKDVYPRYKTMKGFYVARKGGWDTHGLPVEIEVEKQLGLDGKTEVFNYGVEPFIKKCKESVFLYKDEWEKITERMGFWVDTENAYITLDNDYIETVWWALKKIFDDGLLYFGHKVVPFCPHDQTPLSSHEVAQGYKDTKDPSIFIKFKLTDASLNKLEIKAETFFLVWTTTPWTLISNVALAIHPEHSYVLVKNRGENLILAKALLNVLDEGYEVIKEWKGVELTDLSYHQLLPFLSVEDGKKAFNTLNDDFVTIEDGTGIVHMAPAFGEDDYRICREHDFTFFNPVKTDGKFDERITDFAGQFVKDADKGIQSYLKERGLLYRSEIMEHSYPFCWRCETPLLYYARAAWFIETTKIKDKLIDFNKQICWYPSHVREGRFGKFLENLVDWAISRERYWGTPLPIWVCQACEHKIAIGSIEELKEKGRDVPDDIELHKPYIDEIQVQCSKCNAEMKRVPEVVDCWFDAGMMHTAQWHYPFENKEIFAQSFPADFIAEAVDQTRGWFYTLLATSALIHDQIPYKNCIVIGHVLGKDGYKMSKSRGNVVGNWEIFNNQGADAMRWYFYTIATPWQARGFFQEAVLEVVQGFLGTLKNIYSFFVLYANIDGYNPGEHKAKADALNELDSWILSHFNRLIQTVDNHMENFEATLASRAIEEFVDILSNWYLRRNRKRYWGSGMSDDKVAAYETLYTVLLGLCKLTAPFIPFLAERIYQNLGAEFEPDAQESVHLCAYPTVKEKFINSTLEEKMDLVRRVVSLGRTARNSAKIKNRQPLKEISVAGLTETQRMYAHEASDIILEELNIKDIRFLNDSSEFLTFDVKPNFRNLGKKYGKLVPKIQRFLKEFEKKDELALIFQEGKEFSFKIYETEIILDNDLVSIQPISRPGFKCEMTRGLLVALNTEIDQQLKLEGYAREIVNKIQFMRKKGDFNITDRIEVLVSPFEKFQDIEENYGELIERETLSKIQQELAEISIENDWEINDRKLHIALLNPEKNQQ